jgi:hypothetical protein
MCMLLRPRTSVQPVSVLADLRPALASATGRLTAGSVVPRALRPVLAAA